MSGFGRHFEKELTCPFCKKGKIMANYKEGYTQSNTSRISGKSAQIKSARRESYHIQSDCPKCGKTAKEIEKAFNTGVTREIPLEERLARIKASGLPLKFTSKKKD